MQARKIMQRHMTVKMIIDVLCIQHAAFANALMSAVKSLVAVMAGLHPLLHRVCVFGFFSLFATGLAHAAPLVTPLSLLASSTQADAVLACLALRVEPALVTELPSGGLEVRVAMHPASSGTHFSLTLLLKPDVSSLLDVHDDEAEAHVELQTALLNKLRYPIATRVYPWRNSADCHTAADWLSTMRRQAVDMGK